MVFFVNVSFNNLIIWLNQILKNLSNIISWIRRGHMIDIQLYIVLSITIANYIIICYVGKKILWNKTHIPRYMFMYDL